VIDVGTTLSACCKGKVQAAAHVVDVADAQRHAIPRTLYLALTGARDMSTIRRHHTTPAARPSWCNTTNVSFADAIQREADRSGRFLFGTNRVMTIEIMRSKLQALVPHARIVVGHGQMEIGRA